MHALGFDSARSIISAISSPHSDAERTARASSIPSTVQLYVENTTVTESRYVEALSAQVTTFVNARVLPLPALGSVRTLTTPIQSSFMRSFPTELHECPPLRRAFAFEAR